MPTKKISFVIFAVIVIGIGVFCYFYSDRNPQTETYDEESNESIEPVAVGMILPLSGPLAESAESIQRSVGLVKTDDLKFIYEDDMCDGKKALSAYLKLHAEGVRIFSVACSGSVLAIAPHAQTNGDIILTAFAGSIDIRNTGPEVIRFIPDGLTVVEVMEQYFNMYPDAQYGLLHEQQDYASSVSDAVEHVLGDRLVLKESYSSETTDFSTELLKFSRSDIDAVILVPVSDDTAQLIYKQIQQLHISLPFIGDVNMCDYPFLPSDYGISGVCWKAQLNTDGYHDFIENYQTQYHLDPSYPFYDALTYESVNMLSKAVSTGERDIESIRAFILAGGTGDITELEFDDSGNIIAGDYLELVRF